MQHAVPAAEFGPLFLLTPEDAGAEESHVCHSRLLFSQAGGIQGLVASQLLEALGSFRSCEKAWQAAVGGGHEGEGHSFCYSLPPP